MMVRLYCRKQEGNDCLCEECRALLEYAHARLEHCPFGERKTSCKHCKIHCYKPGMRQKMRQVMRYAGPRMLFDSRFIFSFYSASVFYIVRPVRLDRSVKAFLH